MNTAHEAQFAARILDGRLQGKRINGFHFKELAYGEYRFHAHLRGYKGMEYAIRGRLRYHHEVVFPNTNFCHHDIVLKNIIIPIPFALSLNIATVRSTGASFMQALDNVTKLAITNSDRRFSAYHRDI